MLKKKDPIAMALFEQYDNLAMPNMRLNKQEALALLDYIDAETHRLLGRRKQKRPVTAKTAAFPIVAGEATGDVVAIMDAWVCEAHPEAKVNAGYMTLVNVGSEPVVLTNVESEAFESIAKHEMVQVDGMMEMRAVSDLVVPSTGQVQLKPGGKHLMLMGPRRHFAKGQRVAMTLTFQSGRKQTLSVQVAAR